MERSVREQPFGPGMVVWTIDGHMFAAYTESGHGLSVRVAEAQTPTAEDNADGPVQLPGAGWVVIPWETPPEVLRSRIAASYQLVLADRNGAAERD